MIQRPRTPLQLLRARCSFWPFFSYSSQCRLMSAATRFHPVKTNLVHFPTQMARAYNSEVAEREYSLASAQLQLADARRHNKVLQFQRNVLSDDFQRACGESAILAAQLKEEQESCDLLKLELATVQKALVGAARALTQADHKVKQLMVCTRSTEQTADLSMEAQDTNIFKRLAKAEAGLVAATRREASLEQLLSSERNARRELEASSAFGTKYRINTPCNFAQLPEERKSRPQHAGVQEKPFVEHRAAKKLRHKSVEQHGIQPLKQRTRGKNGTKLEADKRHEDLQSALHQNLRCIQKLGTKVANESEPVITVQGHLHRQDDSLVQGVNHIGRGTHDTCDNIMKLPAEPRFLDSVNLLPANNHLPRARGGNADSKIEVHIQTDESPIIRKRKEQGKVRRSGEVELTKVTIHNVIDDLSARGYVSPVSHFGGPINGEESRLGSACVPPDDHVSANVAPSLGIQDSSSSKQIKVPTVSDGSNFPLSNVSRSPLNSIQDTQIEKVMSRENKLHKKKRKLLGQCALASSDTLPSSVDGFLR